MQIALCRSTALEILRALRCGAVSPRNGRRCNLPAPRPDGKTWTRSSLASRLEPFGLGAFSDDHPLEVAVPSAAQRIRTRGVVCTVHSGGLPHGAFLHLGRGIAMSSPELLFVEMAQRLSLAELMVLGCELCGTYSLLPSGEGLGARDIPPVTSTQKLRSFIARARNVKGMAKALRAVGYGLDNAWSPMESVLACLLVLPGEEYGYDMGSITLNRRYEANGAPTERGSRVPDIVFDGTSVGFNYDGGSHFEGEGEQTVRRQMVEDKRRDRDLCSMGLTVLPLTSEDLYEVDGLDRVVLQAISIIEREGGGDLSRQRKMIASRILRKRRQQLVWSLLPGKEEEARRRLQEMEEESMRGMRVFSASF